MIDNQTLIGGLRIANREAFMEIPELLGKPTIYDALTLLLDEGFNCRQLAEKFDIEYHTVRRVILQIRPDNEDLRVKGISTTRSERHGLRLRDGTTLREHCRRLNLGTPQSSAYARERRRLDKAGELLTADEYQRILRYQSRC